MIKNCTTMLIGAVASATIAFSGAPVRAQGAPPVGNAQAGAGKVAMCIGCHGIPGYRASFPELYKVPKISGQGAPYIVAALTAYQKGERKHPTMRSIADSLTEQDMADIAAFYAGHGKTLATGAAPARAPDAKVQALLDKGACLSCHGEGFAKPIDPSYPKVAGQYADYLYAALKAYKTEGNPYIGRSNPVMGAIAKQFSNAELQTLARYLAGLESEIQTLPQSSFRVAREQP